MLGCLGSKALTCIRIDLGGKGALKVVTALIC